MISVTDPESAALALAALLSGAALSAIVARLRGILLEREHAQHLYKVANRKGVSVKRLAWYEGLNPFAWNEDGFADVALPVVAMLITAAVLE